MTNPPPQSPLPRQAGQSALLFISAALMAVTGVQVKALTALLPVNERLPDLEVTFARFAFGLAVMLILAAAGRVRLQSQRPGGLLLRGLFGTVAIALYFYSITHTQLGKGTLLSYTYIVFAPFFSGVWLRERPPPAAILALMVATLGIVLLVRPDFHNVNGGDVAGLAGGVTAGLALATVRDLRRTESSPVIFFALCLCGTVAVGLALALATLGLPLTSIPPRVPGAPALLLLLGVGIASTLAQLLLTWGFRYVSTALGSLISITTVPLSALAGVLLFGESLHWTTLAGALLVLAAGVALSAIEAAPAAIEAAPATSVEPSSAV